MNKTTKTTKTNKKRTRNGLLADIKNGKFDEIRRLCPFNESKIAKGEIIEHPKFVMDIINEVAHKAIKKFIRTEIVSEKVIVTTQGYAMIIEVDNRSFDELLTIGSNIGLPFSVFAKVEEDTLLGGQLHSYCLVLECYYL